MGRALFHRKMAYIQSNHRFLTYTLVSCKHVRYGFLPVGKISLFTPNEVKIGIYSFSLEFVSCNLFSVQQAVLEQV